MDVLTSLFDARWRTAPGAIVGLVGLAILWHGLLGGHGLLRRGFDLLARLDGWRQSVFGLAVIGLGAAWIWESRLLLFLAVGIGFTEIREASAVISALKREGKRGRASEHVSRHRQQSVAS